MSYNDEAPGERVEVPEYITCVDCGGRCGLLTRPTTDDQDVPVPFEAGDIVAYRCADCLDRWDIVIE
jgi:DNA-directed RNA polymerase subunit RPC12/RpoP